MLFSGKSNWKNSEVLNSEVLNVDGRVLKAIIIGMALIFLAFLFISYSSYSVYANTSPAGNLTYKQVTVQKGDTLWELTGKINSNIDRNTLISLTMKYNNLKTTYIQSGQVLYLPTGL